MKPGCPSADELRQLLGELPSDGKADAAVGTGDEYISFHRHGLRRHIPHDPVQLRYCSSLTFSIQSTALPFSFS